MEKTLERIMAMTPFYYPLKNWVNRKRQQQELADWEARGRSGPPPHIVKQQSYAEDYQLRVLVETGTNYGHMVEAMRTSFDTIYSIELSQDLFQRAQARFKSARHIRLLQGDSGKVLAEVIKEINRPALLGWMDTTTTTV